MKQVLVHNSHLKSFQDIPRMYILFNYNFLIIIMKNILMIFGDGLIT